MSDKEQEPDFEELNIFTDPNGPYMTAPKKFQELLDRIRKEQRLDLENISLPLMDLPERRTGKNFCTNQLQHTFTDYAICEDCSLDIIDQKKKRYCTRCFDPSKHVGHKYQTQNHQFYPGYCSCGKVGMLEKQSFCDEHSHYNKQIQCEIPEEQRGYFLQCMTILFKCSLYTKKTTLFFMFLNKINQHSVYYNRLTYEFIPILVANYSNHSNQEIRQKNVSDLMNLVNGDLRTNKMFIKQISDPKFRQGQLKFLYNQAFIEQVINLTSVEQLIEEGFHSQFLQKFLHTQILKKSTINKYFQTKIQKCTKLDRLLREKFIFNDNQVIVFFLRKICQLFPNFQNQYHHFKQMQDSSKNNELQQLNSQLEQKVIAYLLLIIHHNQPNILNIRQYLAQKGLTLQDLDILTNLMLNKIQSADKKMQIRQIVTWLLLRGTKDQKRFLKIFWKTTPMEGQLNKVTLKYLVAVFYFNISRILKASDLIIFYTKMIFKRVSNNNVEKKLEKFLRQLLQSKKVIQRGEILQLKKNGVINFSSAAKILDELCQYDEEKKVFRYKGPNLQRSVLHQFPAMYQQCDINSMYNNHIQFGQEVPFEQGSIEQVLVQQLLSADNIIPNLDKAWANYKQDAKVKAGAGYLYLFCLVVFDSLTNGSDKQLRQRLEGLRDRPEDLGQYSTSSEELSMIRRLLGIQSKQQKETEVGKQEGKGEVKQEGKQEDDIGHYSQQKQEQYRQKQVAAEHKRKQVDLCPLIQLPIEAGKFIKKYKIERLCQKCNIKEQEWLCLHCQKKLCYQCKQEKHEQNTTQLVHIFFIHLKKLSLISGRQPNHEISIYQNQFHVPYNREWPKKFTFQKDYFRLNKPKMQREIQKLINKLDIE